MSKYLITFEKAPFSYRFKPTDLAPELVTVYLCEGNRTYAETSQSAVKFATKDQALAAFEEYRVFYYPLLPNYGAIVNMQIKRVIK